MTTSHTKPAGRLSSAPAKRKPQAAKRDLSAAEGFVFLAITLVAVALGTGLYLQFGMEFWIATVTALSVYIGLLSMHSLIRRRDTVDDLRSEVARLRGELHRTQGAGQAQHAAPPSVASRMAANRQPELIGEAAAPATKISAEGLLQAATPHTHPKAKEAARDSAAPLSAGPTASATGEQLQETTPPASLTATDGFTAASAQVGAKPAGASDSSGSLDQFWAGLDLAESPAPAKAVVAPPPPLTATTKAAGAAAASAEEKKEEAGNTDDPTANYEVIAAPPAAAEQPPASPPITDPLAASTEMASQTSSETLAAMPNIKAGPLTDGAGEDDDGPPTLIGATQSRRDAKADTPSTDDAEQALADDAPVMPPREKDVELIQGLIKKLADEVNAIEEQQTQVDNAGPGAIEPVADTETAIESSVGALRTAVDSMRVYEDEAPAAPGNTQPVHSPASLEGFQKIDAQQVGTQPTQAAPPPVGPSHTRLAAVADAITSGRVDVMLEPILGLKDKRTRHFEVSVRLRGTDGVVLDAPQDVPEIAGTGLLPLLDAGHIGRTAQLAHHLRARGKTGAVFTSMAPESLTADRFLDAFDATHQAGMELSRQLVMTFSQFDIRRFGANEWQTVHHMKTLGFRFAISAVTDMDMDFEDLKSKGFDFVKLDAEVFLEGLPTGEGRIPSQDVCGFLAQLGMTLIVGHIDDDNVLARIHDLGVLYGQGQLFGGARPVKQEALGLPASHAAA